MVSLHKVPTHTTLQELLRKPAETLGVKGKKLIPKAMATRQVFEAAKLERLSGTSGNSLHEPRGEMNYSTPFPQPLFHVFLLNRKGSNNKNGSWDYKSKDLLTDTSGTP